MNDSPNLKLQLLDELCDKLDDCGIDGNVIERDSHGAPYVNIWYGSYEDRELQASQMFTVVITDNSLYISPSGCYEITPPGKYRDYFKDTFQARRSSSGFYAWIMPSDLIIRTIKFLFDREKLEKKKENKMNINIINKEFSLADQMLGKLKKCGIKYRMNIGKNGIYNPEEMIISTTSSSTGIETDICLLRSIPNSESTRFAFEVRWSNTNVPSYILANLKIDRVKEYELSDEVIIDILLIERELDACTAFKTFVRTNKLPTIRAVDVIFNDPATIIIWADGSKTVVKAENEKFDPEKGLAMAISKKVLGNKHDYYEVFKRYVGRYEKKQGKKERAAQARANKNVKPTDSNKDKKQKLDNERC